MPGCAFTVPPETAEANPDWEIDLCDEVIGTWRGEQGKAAAMTLVWGRPLVDGGAVVTAELADLNVDQCVLVEGRFTLIAPDAYRQALEHASEDLDAGRHERARRLAHRPAGVSIGSAVDCVRRRIHPLRRRHVDDQSLLLAWPWALIIVSCGWSLATVIGPFETTGCWRSC